MFSCRTRLIRWRQEYLPVLAVPYPARPVGFFHNFLKFILWSFKKLPWGGLDSCARQRTHLMWSCSRAVRRTRISDWLRPQKQHLREGVEIASWDAWYFDFSKKNQELVWGKHSGILKYGSNIATTEAFATDVVSYGSERTEDARQWRLMYLHGRVIDLLSSPRQWSAGYRSSSTPRFWVAETFLNYCTLYMYTSSKQCTKNWQHVWRHLCICRLCSHL